MGVKGGDGAHLEPVEDDPWAEANEAIMARVNARGRTFLSHTRLRGRLSLRLAIGNLRTTRADVDEAWAEIVAAADEVERESGGV